MIIPERQTICKALQSEKRALRVNELAALFKLSKEQVKVLNNRLEAMVRDGQLSNREGAYRVGEEAKRVTGVFIASDGSVSVRIDSADGVYLALPDRLTRGLVDGDQIAVYILGQELDDECLPVSIEILARDREIAGVVNAAGYIEPLHEIGPSRVQILAGDEDSLRNSLHAGLKEGDVVLVHLCKPDLPGRSVSGKVLEVLSDSGSAAQEIDIVLRAYNIPSRWSDELLGKSRRCETLPQLDSARRRDLLNMDFVTIDGEDAKDFDDAVFFEKSSSGWNLWVAIADVASYVKPGSLLDEAARERGNSVYFPGRVVPMLPPLLSDGLCSLLPREKRLSLVCRVSLSRHGKILEYEFMRAVIFSRARLTYTQVGQFFKSGKGLDACSSEVRATLREGLRVFEVLLKQRKARGALDLDTLETRMLFDKEGTIRQIVPFERNDAHRLIEECMICANICAAEFLAVNHRKALHRVHAGFKKDSVENLKFFLRERGVSLRGESNHDISLLLKQVAGREDAYVVQIMILRSLTRALYQPEEPGHYGLALEHYAHFTSPIRRYPDLIVHRAINAVIDPDSASSKSYDTSELRKIGEHCSMTERRADDATRDVTKYLKCLFVQKRVGETFTGIIVGVTHFGLFLELEKLYVEGLLHIGSLTFDYFHFDGQGHRLVGESSGQVYRLGDRMEVVVSRVFPEGRKVDFVLPGSRDTGKRPRRSRRK